MSKDGAGKLQERLAFDQRQDLDDGYGNTKSDWIEQFTRRGGFTFLRGGETVIASRLEGRQPAIVRVRADSSTRTITNDWRMRDLRTSKVYAVRSVIETTDRMWIDISVESGVTA